MKKEKTMKLSLPWFGNHDIVMRYVSITLTAKMDEMCRVDRYALYVVKID